jgi:ComF family protein
VIKTLNTYTKDFLHLFFPHYCEGCGSDVVEQNELLCLQCVAKLPETKFFEASGNPVEKTFYGRIPVKAAGATYYFTKDSLMQHLISELKYRGNKKIGNYLGKLTGHALIESNRFAEIDFIVPLPLNEKKLHKRGYNQAAVIAEGIATVIEKPVLQNLVVRKHFTETQTRKDRVHRWQNMQNVFEVIDPSSIENKQILLVDDIITTGATLEACGVTLLKVPGLTLHIASVAWTI